MLGLCGISRERGQIPILSSVFNDEIASLREQYQEKIKEIERLREEANRIDSEKDQILITQHQMQEMVEAQEAEIERIRRRMPGGTTTKYWEDKVAEEIAAMATITATQREEEEQILVLQEELAELKTTVEAQSRNIELVKKSVPGYEELSASAGTSSFTAGDGASGFVSRLAQLRTGDLMSVWKKDKFEPVFVSVSPDCKEIRFAANSKKKPYQTIKVDDVESLSYPVKTPPSNGKEKEPSKPYMQFGITSATDQQTHVMLSASVGQLVDWCVGLQNLTAKPGQKLMDKGGVLWLRTQAKLHHEAQQRGLSVQRMVAQAFLQMLPEDEKQVVEVVEEEDEGN